MSGGNGSAPFVLALPKGRILRELAPLLAQAGLEPETDFNDDNTRKLRFATSDPKLELIRVRSFDVATFVAFGAAQLGVAGNDVLLEFDYPEIYAPVDLGIGKCRLAVAEPAEMVGENDPNRWSHIRVATKYPNITRDTWWRPGYETSRSEEHTSELQSQSNLVCRLLLEKKNKKI